MKIIYMQDFKDRKFGKRIENLIDIIFKDEIISGDLKAEKENLLELKKCLLKGDKMSPFYSLGRACLCFFNKSYYSTQNFLDYTFKYAPKNKLALLIKFKTLRNLAEYGRSDLYQTLDLSNKLLKLYPNDLLVRIEIADFHLVDMNDKETSLKVIKEGKKLTENNLYLNGYLYDLTKIKDDRIY